MTSVGLSQLTLGLKPASDAFHIQFSHLICSANELTCFNVKSNNVLKWVRRHCVEIVQIRTRKNSVFGHFSRSEDSQNLTL